MLTSATEALHKATHCTIGPPQPPPAVIRTSKVVLKTEAVETPKPKEPAAFKPVPPKFIPVVIECYQADADEPRIKEIRDQFFQDEHPHGWYMKEFSKTLSIIFCYNLKPREQKLDPVNTDEWNQKVIWLMSDSQQSVSKWIARRSCFMRHFRTCGLRRAFDACKLFTLPTKVTWGDWFNVDIPVNVAIKWSSICTFEKLRSSVSCITYLMQNGTAEIMKKVGLAAIQGHTAVTRRPFGICLDGNK